MRTLLSNLLPLLLFFAAYRAGNIQIAAAMVILTSVVQIIYLKLQTRVIEPIRWINLILVTVFSGATLWSQDSTFIKWKPTVLYWLTAITLYLSQLLWKRNLIQHLLIEHIALPDPVWNRLNSNCVMFLISIGLLNLYVAFSGYFTESQWVSFKVFGLTSTVMVFIITHSVWITHKLRQSKVKDLKSI